MHDSIWSCDTSAANSSALCSTESPPTPQSTSSTLNNLSSSFHLENGDSSLCINPPSVAITLLCSVNYLELYCLPCVHFWVWQPITNCKRIIWPAMSPAYPESLHLAVNAEVILVGKHELYQVLQPATNCNRWSWFELTSHAWPVMIFFQSSCFVKPWLFFIPNQVVLLHSLEV